MRYKKLMDPVEDSILAAVVGRMNNNITTFNNELPTSGEVINRYIS
jgi:hypothetical protein